MGGEDIEEIIKKLQEKEGNKRTEEGIAGARVSEQEAVCVCFWPPVTNGLL